MPVTLEGLVSKRSDSRYRAGRSPDWIKVKNPKSATMHRVMDAFMTVFVYVNTSKQVGDPDHLNVFATRKPRKLGLKRTTRRAWPSNTR